MIIFLARIIAAIIVTAYALRRELCGDTTAY